MSVYMVENEVGEVRMEVRSSTGATFVIATKPSVPAPRGFLRRFLELFRHRRPVE